LRVPPSSPAPINAATRLCAVLGSPIRHSASPAMHNAAYAALGLNWRYLAFEVDPKNLRAAIEGARAMNFAGLNLTVPHKLLAVDMVDELDASAKTWGAVNTIKFENGRAIGFNTDADGFIRAIKEEFDWPKEGLRGASVLLIGAGGAARPAALRLAQEKISQLFLVNRTLEKAEQLKKQTAELYPDLEIEVASDVKLIKGLSHDPVSLVVNATSLGLKSDDPLPIDLEWLKLKRPRRVYDMIYRPEKTPLLVEAEKAAISFEAEKLCKVANGLGMLLYQGAKAFEIWTDRPAPLDVMRRALEQNIYGR
jgi:shikimate dehydrogenase